MKVYLAARYERQEEMREYARVLSEHGHTVVSQWVHTGRPNAFTPEELNETPNVCAPAAASDLADVYEAHCVINFTSGRAEDRGGRHVEFGVALVLSEYAIAPVTLIVIGRREHVFHTHPRVLHFESWKQFVASDTFRLKFVESAC